MRAFGALPSEKKAQELKEREVLWCALNLMLDEEERLAQMCPECRERAESGCCTVCGKGIEPHTAGVNEGFDWARYEMLRRGERA